MVSPVVVSTGVVSLVVGSPVVLDVVGVEVTSVPTVVPGSLVDRVDSPVDVSVLPAVLPEVDALPPLSPHAGPSVAAVKPRIDNAENLMRRSLRVSAY
ncbi:hypothetical protein OV203_47310 [Nannocystis sp. ILAH1]|uniref:hypothetical protein n=1 Tax=Nannocystis sp. ILAH1 TaxID=2996789 RepID=UPI0022710A14|nr:hypothetical protein [Nannocystis sp. ILAH1]MCY0994827.1 hypothetical protein [Nannocystis sp. ILAH1]